MDEPEESIPAAETLISTEESVSTETTVKKSLGNETCLNCGTTLEDQFCHHCGQKDIPRRQTLGELFLNFISSFWSYEGKFFRTTKYLIIKPGFLAQEYNAGRRESYFHPARMYVFISFVFFLLFFSLPDTKKSRENSKAVELSAEDREELRQARVDSIIARFPVSDSLKNQAKAKKTGKNRFTGGGIKNADFKTVKAYDSAQNTLAEKDRDGWVKHRLVSRLIEMNQNYGDQPSKFGENFVSAFKDNFSKLLFYLLPIFALLLRLLYIRKDYYYSEHLVFSIYYYNFFFLAASLQMLANQVSWLGWLGSLIGYWIFFYLLFAMKRMYQQPWGKTILKFTLFIMTFFVVALIGMGFTAIMIIMFV